jgi:FtsZ-binding cell division protein ZapB
MVDEYNETQQHILDALQSRGGREVSGTIKDMVQYKKQFGSITRSGVDKQLQALRESGEIEVVDKLDDQMGTNVYGLTELGEAAIDGMDMIAPGMDERVDELEARVDELQQENEELRERFDSYQSEMRDILSEIETELKS